jgi:hypothetical protein
MRTNATNETRGRVKKEMSTACSKLIAVLRAQTSESKLFLAQTILSAFQQRTVTQERITDLEKKFSVWKQAVETKFPRLEELMANTTVCHYRTSRPDFSSSDEELLERHAWPSFYEDLYSEILGLFVMYGDNMKDLGFACDKIDLALDILCKKKVDTSFVGTAKETASRDFKKYKHPGVRFTAAPLY